MIKNIENLQQKALEIPSMDDLELRKFLRMFAAQSPSNAAIVEVGTWLGGGTAQLALGVVEREDNIAIHSYDRFYADESEARRAKQFGLALEPNSDTKPIVEKMLKPFPVEVHLHKEDLYKISWKNGPIGLYVDDAAKSPTAFYKIIEIFSPDWVPGKTVLILQDYGFWRRQKSARGRRRYKVQKQFMERYKDYFTRLEVAELKGSTMAIFRYEKPFPLWHIKVMNRIRMFARKFKLKK